MGASVDEHSLCDIRTPRTVPDALNPDDVIFEGYGAKSVVDPKADFFIGGSVVDYVESLMSSGFVVTNPQAVSTCSCGKSFST